MSVSSEWCGDAQPSAYADKNGAFAGYNIPAYFSEFGCITSPPRLWTEVATMFASPMTDIWSGGLAFSYFPATSSQGQFGMVTISSDNTTVTTSDDFTRLQAEYGNVTFVNSPSAPGSTTFPSCPTANSTFLASQSLPPTPNDNSCNCLESSLACQFTPTTSNTSAIVGPLLDTACGLLGQVNGNCDAIAADGAAGTYGPVSFCNPCMSLILLSYHLLTVWTFTLLTAIKLSYVMDQYYEATNRVATSCSFGGNATINSQAPSAASASAAASSCLSNPDATFVPSPPATLSGSSPTGSSSGSGSSGNKDNGASTLSNKEAMMGMVLATVFSVAGGLFALA